jgi:hypothetical protein
LVSGERDRRVLSYREQWRRQQQERQELVSTCTSFTALLELEALGMGVGRLGARSPGLNQWAPDGDKDGYGDGEDYGVGFGCDTDSKRDSWDAGQLLEGQQGQESMLEDAQYAQYAAYGQQQEQEQGGALAADQRRLLQASPFKAIDPAAPCFQPPSFYADRGGNGCPVSSLPSFPSFPSTAEQPAPRPQWEEEGETDGDNLSIQDIDCDDISPAPAGTPSLE